jgi:hypothetical protein
MQEKNIELNLKESFMFFLNGCLLNLGLGGFKTRGGGWSLRKIEGNLPSS